MELVKKKKKKSINKKIENNKIKNLPLNPITSPLHKTTNFRIYLKKFFFFLFFLYVGFAKCILTANNLLSELIYKKILWQLFFFIMLLSDKSYCFSFILYIQRSASEGSFDWVINQLWERALVAQGVW